MNRSQLLLVLIALVLTTPPSPAQPADSVIFDMDAIRHRPTEITKDKLKIPAGTVELVDGKFGKAVRFAFVQGPPSGFMAASLPATPDWDHSDGFSFWVKGDGSASWGGIEIIDKSDFGLRYGYCFPIDSTEWKKIVVPWSELTPELAGPLVSTKGGYAPSSFGNFWFGKWFYWRDYPAHSYAIDQVVLEKEIGAEPLPTVEPGLKRFRDKLKAGKPVTIVTMGDSLSDTRHWANKPLLWSQLLAADLKAKYGNDVKLVNPAMGGTTLSQNLVVMPRWVKEVPSPDLVLVWFGFNDWDSGVRGPRFTEYLRIAVDRIRRQTRGSADILLLTTAPAHGRWETMKEMEQAVRDVAAEKKTGLADIAAEFRKPGNPDDALKLGIWAWDKVHLGQKGHETAKDTVLRAIAE